MFVILLLRQTCFVSIKNIDVICGTDTILSSDSAKFDATMQLFSKYWRLY